MQSSGPKLNFVSFTYRHRPQLINLKDIRVLLCHDEGVTERLTLNGHTSGISQRSHWV